MKIDCDSKYPVYSSSKEEYAILAEKYKEKFGKYAPPIPENASPSVIGNTYSYLRNLVFPQDLTSPF